MPKRIVPRAVLVLPASVIEKDRRKWLEERRNGVGGSDIPVILGFSPYRDQLGLWHEKLGHLGDDGGNEAARWGQLLEDAIARKWATDRKVRVRRVGLVANAITRWQMASLDRLVAGCERPGQCALEVKTRSAWKLGDWSQDVPDDVLAQVQWQLLVTGLDHVHVACLIGGNKLYQFSIEPESDIQRYITAEAETFWQSVLTQEPPDEQPGELLADMYARLYPNPEGDREVDASEADKWIRAYDAAHEDEKAAKLAKTEAASMLAHLLNGGERALVHGDPAYTYRPQMRDTVDMETLRGIAPQLITKQPTKPGIRRVKAYIPPEVIDGSD